MSRGDSTRYFAYAFVVLCLLIPQASSAAGRGLQADNSSATKTSGPTPVLIELFTSEGCSSCPPVDVFLKNLDSAQPIPGAQLIVLSEHVIYWDQDGWKDPNSSAALTARQNSYEASLGQNQVYTPQLIVDGSHEVKPGDPKQVEETLLKAAATPKVPVRIGEVTVDAGNPTVLHAR